MDYENNAIARANADYHTAIYDVEGWLKQLESVGATVSDLQERIKIMQAVATKLSDTAKIDTSKIDVRKAYSEGLCCSFPRI